MSREEGRAGGVRGRARNRVTQPTGQMPDSQCQAVACGPNCKGTDMTLSGSSLDWDWLGQGCRVPVNGSGRHSAADPPGDLGFSSRLGGKPERVRRASRVSEGGLAQGLVQRPQHPWSFCGRSEERPGRSGQGGGSGPVRSVWPSTWVWAVALPFESNAGVLVWGAGDLGLELRAAPRKKGPGHLKLSPFPPSPTPYHPNLCLGPGAIDP